MTENPPKYELPPLDLGDKATPHYPLPPDYGDGDKFRMPIIQTRQQQRAEREAARGDDALVWLTWLLFVAGLCVLAYGVIQPYQYDMRTASAVQLTQVYSQTTNTILIGVGLLVAAGVAGVARLQATVREGYEARRKEAEKE